MHLLGGPDFKDIQVMKDRKKKGEEKRPASEGFEPRISRSRDVHSSTALQQLPYQSFLKKSYLGFSQEILIGLNSRLLRWRRRSLEAEKAFGHFFILGLISTFFQDCKNIKLLQIVRVKKCLLILIGTYWEAAIQISEISYYITNFF